MNYENTYIFENTTKSSVRLGLFKEILAAK